MDSGHIYFELNKCSVNPYLRYWCVEIMNDNIKYKYPLLADMNESISMNLKIDTPSKNSGLTDICFETKWVKLVNKQCIPKLDIWIFIFLCTNYDN